MNTEISHAETLQSCEVCHCTENLKTCSRCHCAFYCGREHQVLHWAVHKQICKDFRSDIATTVSRPVVAGSLTACPPPPSLATENTSNNVSAHTYATWSLSNSYLDDAINTADTKVITPEHSYSEWNMNSLITRDAVASSQSFDQTSNSASEKSDSDNLQIDNDLLDLTTKYLLAEHYADSNMENESMDYDLTNVTEQIFDHSCSSLVLPEDVRMQEIELASCMPFELVCNSIVHDLNVHGICVIDKFLGFEVGEHILGEVKELFQRGIFQKGQLVSSNVWKSTEGIRGDFISWVSGTEPGSEYIGSLIRRLDDAMNRCSKMKDNGILSRYKLSKRTKAMVACYPGNGTHYKKHVDNPDGDGRCITCIYYLNKNWDVEKHGGLLRMFPTSHKDEIANIEPIFDRMLFFWSDRRNPHEVLPSYAVRFAITVWYFNSDERELALIRSSLQQKQ